MINIRKLLGLKTKEEKLKEREELNLLKHELRKKISCLTKPAVHIVKTDCKSKSKFGGKPVADSLDFEWPMSSNGPLSFLAQFDLSEIANQVKFNWLGESGSILFFYDIEEMPWGFDPKDKAKWRVIYQSNPSVDIEYPSGLKRDLILPERHVKMRRVELLPPYQDESIRNLNLSDLEIDLYFEIEEHFKEFDAFGSLPAHQIGGFPRPVQGDNMQFEAWQASEGVYMGDEKAYKKATDEEFEFAKRRWQLLFQFDSDQELDLIWGDLGMLYFWVESSQSEKGNYKNSWLILQCT